MKPGLYIGYKENLEVVVAEEMVASFGGETIHLTLSTVMMIYYMEWVSRKVILPFLEEREEGVGASINVNHRSPAPVGQKVLYTANVISMDETKVICKVQAEINGYVVGEGEFVQVILSKTAIRNKIEKMKTIPPG